jgi:predicted transcriptional regulator
MVSDYKKNIEQGKRDKANSIMEICSKEATPVAEISQAIGYTVGTCNLFLDVLEQVGLIRRFKSRSKISGRKVTVFEALRPIEESDYAEISETITEAYSTVEKTYNSAESGMKEEPPVGVTIVKFSDIGAKQMETAKLARMERKRVQKVYVGCTFGMML